MGSDQLTTWGVTQNEVVRCSPRSRCRGPSGRKRSGSRCGMQRAQLRLRRRQHPDEWQLQPEGRPGGLPEVVPGHHRLPLLEVEQAATRKFCNIHYDFQGTIVEEGAISGTKYC